MTLLVRLTVDWLWLSFFENSFFLSLLGIDGSLLLGSHRMMLLCLFFRDPDSRILVIREPWLKMSVFWSEVSVKLLLISLSILVLLHEMSVMSFNWLLVFSLFELVLVFLLQLVRMLTVLFLEALLDTILMTAKVKANCLIFVICIVPMVLVIIFVMSNRVDVVVLFMMGLVVAVIIVLKSRFNVVVVIDFVLGVVWLELFLYSEDFSVGRVIFLLNSEVFVWWPRNSWWLDVLRMIRLKLLLHRVVFLFNHGFFLHNLILFFWSQLLLNDLMIWFVIFIIVSWRLYDINSNWTHVVVHERHAPLCSAGDKQTAAATEAVPVVLTCHAVTSINCTEHVARQFRRLSISDPGRFLLWCMMWCFMGHWLLNFYMNKRLVVRFDLLNFYILLDGVSWLLLLLVLALNLFLNLAESSIKLIQEGVFEQEDRVQCSRAVVSNQHR